MNKKVILGITAMSAVIPATILLTSFTAVEKVSGRKTTTNMFSKMNQSNYSAHETIDKFVVQGNKNIITVHDEVKSDTSNKLEGRWMYHGDHIPTGLLVRKGQKIKINVDEMSPGSKPRIYVQAPGEWSGLKDTGSERISLKNGDNEVVAPNTGVIYVTIDGKNAKVKYEIENTNLEKVPTYYKGDDEAAFLEEVKKSDSPVVNIMSDWVVNMVGTKMFKNTFLTSSGTAKHNVSVNKTLEKWDELVETYTRISGLSTNGTGLNRKYGHKINLFAPKGGHGWASFGGTVSIGQNWFSGSLKGKAEWVLGHELGHTWQNGNMSWEGVTQVVPNIFAALWQEKYSELSTKDKPWNKIVEEQPHAINNIRNAMDKGGFKNFDSVGWSEKLMMYLQLQKAFGDNFMPTLSQYYRINHSKTVEGRKGLSEAEKVLRSEGLDTENPFGDIVNTKKEERQQVFMRAVMNITGYDLTNFFKVWGFKLNEETLANAKGKKVVTKAIERNYLKGTSPKVMNVQELMPKYNPVQISSSDIDFSIDTLMHEPKEVTEAKILAKLKGKIPSNYKVEIVGDKYMDYYTRKVLINVYDPANKFATENGFTIYIKKSNIIESDAKVIPNYGIEDLLEIDLDKKEGDTGFLTGVIVPQQTHFHDLWIFDSVNGRPYHYNEKTTKLKDGMMIRLILDPAYKHKFMDKKYSPKFNENNERIYTKSNGSLVYEKLIKIIN
ncbi:MAG: hypothetical protein HRT98_00060 [Mycoplasmatales bacterium]|nr:hypothetical protein [Mycoplasmatales bacterium]